MTIPTKQESLKEIFSAPEGERKREMREYAFNLLKRDVSHIQFQADMRQANSQELSQFLDEVSEILSRY